MNEVAGISFRTIDSGIVLEFTGDGYIRLIKDVQNGIKTQEFYKILKQFVLELNILEKK